LLGATQPNGLPLDLFTNGTAQWLGIQPNLPAAAEQPRVLLVGMPYALKAADSDTLGGLPASAFVQAAVQASSTAPGGTSSNPANAQAGGQDSIASPLTLGGTGTTDFIPLWTNSTTLGSSVLFQSGSGSSAKVGLNTTTPASTLDVNGAGTVRGTLSLPATGTATATQGFNSQPMDLLSSAFNSTTATAVSQHYRWQAEPAGNNTPSESGKLNLLFAPGAAVPAETGLSIASNGQITFAKGQTFPGTGTITGVTTATGTGLTGGGTTGTLSIGLQKTCSTNQVLQWNGSSWVCATVGTGTIAGVTTAAGSGLTGGGTAGTLAIGLQKTCSTNQVLEWNGSAWACSSTGTISGVTAGTDLTGGGTSGTVTLNLDTTKVPLLSGSNTFTANQTFKVNGNSVQIGDMGCGPGYVGLSVFPGGGNVCTGYALMGDTFGNLFFNRPTGGGVNFREGNGTELAISPGGAITATASITAASFFGDGSQLSNIATLAGNNSFGGFNIFGVNTDFTGNGEFAVIGDVNCGAGSVGISFQGLTGTCSNYALLDYNGQTLLNRTSGQNMSFREGNGADQMTLFSGGQVSINPANHPVFVSGNGTFNDYGNLATLTVLDNTTDTLTHMFEALAPNNGSAGCWIDTAGDMSCFGPAVRAGGAVGSAVQVDDGRQVELSAIQSPEDWFEDYGSGSLSDGAASVALDPTFAQTVNAGVEYHVFLTPKGDCEGLYVANETPTSFEVHEVRGGRSSVGFDYKIVAKRKGRENIRLADKTEMYNQMKARAAQVAEAKKP
jgi:hypothetical protein